MALTAVDIGALVEAAAIGLGAVLVLMLITFAVGVRMGKHSIVDITWGLAFIAVSSAAALASTDRGDGAERLLLLSMVTIWGLRLAIHVGRRNLHAPEDPRYQRLLGTAAHPHRRALTHVYLLQAPIAWFVGLPLVVGLQATGGLTPLAVAGVAVWLIGVAFEAVGDLQLSRFKREPGNRGRLLTTGLWHYTRHPNYFGDACVWWGIFLVVAGHWPGVLTLLSPLVMTLLLTAGSGKPMTEKHMRETRPEYADYVRRTSGFLPLPPRRAAG